MSSAGSCGPAPGPNHGGSGPSNPRKFSEKIALHTQRQAEETAAFQQVMMDLTSTRVQAQKVRLARSQGPYYGGSLPNVNQIGRSASELQEGSFHSPLDSSRSTRHHGLVERVHRDRHFVSPSRPYRRHMDTPHSSAVYLTPPPDPSWRRTNSDSALHTSVMNPPAADPFSVGLSLAAQGRRAVFSYPPPIEENGPDDGRLLKPWDSRKLPLLSSRPRSCEVPGITVFPSPDQQGGAAHGPSVLNTGGSLPDLSSLHFPSPLPTPLDPDEPGYPSLSTGNLTCTLTQLGITGSFHSSGLLPSLQGTSSSPSLQSSLSNPNIQSSLSSHSFPSSASLHSSLSNPSLQSSLSSSPSLRSSLSSQSLQSSLSSSSLQSAASNPSNPSFSGSYAALAPGQVQMNTSPRRRAQLTPVILPQDTRRHHPKQFSPTSSSLGSITQGVALDTSKLLGDQRSSQYSFGQPQPVQKGLVPAQTHTHTHTLRPSSQTAQLHLHNMQNLHKTQNFQLQRPNQNQSPSAGSVCPADAQRDEQSRISELDLYNDTMFLNSLLDDPYLDLQLTSRQNQNLSLSQQLGLDCPDLGSGSVKAPGQQGALELLDSSEQHMQCQAYADGRHTVPNIILTDSPSGLSKEITHALSGVPGFEMDPFCSDDPLALEGLGMLTDGDLMLADPAVEDSFRSDHLK
ncbi:CREB-regulated transcription coactivator 2 [Rhinichthys klamathensis goyatoka]|uniref:CREB-regulated transcription coactivator 2 n=1 Tax=Rhinichthys klamathensis goyatoka TaxID=3034132 RepID=UPI0024B59450|nr:CREB-regulated transcription coactivator 2 [Rhinichthys klamathensis goyatoka]